MLSAIINLYKDHQIVLFDITDNTNNINHVQVLRPLITSKIFFVK